MGHRSCHWSFVFLRKALDSGEEAVLQLAGLKKSKLTQWKKHTAHLRSQRGFAAHGDDGAHPWTSNHKMSGVPDNDRFRDCIDVGYLLARQSNPGLDSDDLVRGYWCDYSQAVQTKPFFRETLATTATSSAYYSYEHDLALPALTHLRLLGWPRSFGSSCTSNAIRSLAGEAVSIPIWSQILFIHYCNPWAPWWQPQEKGSE